MFDDRDGRLLEAIEQVGPVTPHALARHPVASRFDTRGALEDRLAELTGEGHLSRQRFVDVTGETIPEYDAVDG